MIIKHPDKGDYPALFALWQEAFGDDEDFIRCFFETAFSPERCLTVTEDGIPVAVLYWLDAAAYGKKVAYLYAVATKKSHRGRGLSRMLMEHTHRHLQTCGYAASLLVPGEASLFGFYEKLAYRPASGLTFLRGIAKDPIALTPLSPEDYLALRETALPEGGVRQKDESLSFLSRFSDFYRCDGAIFALYKDQPEDKSVLSALEFLPLEENSESLPASIAAAMGFQTYSFRTVGNEVPFSLYYPLSSPALSPPAYLGWAFD